MTLDYADTNITVSNLNESKVVELNKTNEVLLVNDTEVGIAKIENNGKQIIEKPKVPTISMWAKPSVRSGYAYRWYKKTFIDYCPHCHRYKVLLKNPKGVPEREYTCGHCGADYCAVTGKEKYSWSKYYLRRA